MGMNTTVLGMSSVSVDECIKPTGEDEKSAIHCTYYAKHHEPDVSQRFEED
jgi:hypothetical protein